MKLLGIQLGGFAKALVILVAALLVSAGLCGVTNVLAMRNGGLLFQPESTWQTVLGFLGILEIGAFLLSAAGIVFVLFAWPADSIYRLMKRRRVKRQQELSDDGGMPPQDESGRNPVD